MRSPNRAEEIKAGRLLDVIRERPAMYLGEHSLTGLWHFLQGLHLGARLYNEAAVTQLPNDFDDWVAYRLHCFESTRGWRRMILDQIPDERAALDRFYELLDEFRARQPRVVAVFLREDRQRPTAECKLIAYTQDPGLFLECAGDDQSPRNGRLYWNDLSRIPPRNIKVIDQVAYDRWLAEFESYQRRWRSRPIAPFGAGC